MKIKLINQISTNNFTDDKLMEKIQHLWKQAYQNIDDKKILYGVYHNYESNYKGDYSLAVGIEDPNKSDVQINEHADYQVFPVDAKDEAGIMKTWQHIWNLEESGELKRAYTVDFEKYYPDGTIEIHIAI
ncbi:GyrI-like domain-containing protein [Gracilibacillus xinjiangensis]|uniref:GyrI-like domain-containing protein n=1 Tax=Gracilibacillus xinjiangensis TaxID=1193282 RepID=A0ABV8WY54_9BACI